MRLRSLLAILGVGATVASLAHGASPAYDASLAVHFEWAQGTRGSVELRDDIARESLDALAEKGCFREIQNGDPANSAELHLEVVFWDLIEETEFDDSMSERADPSRPKPALRLTASFEIMVGWTLRAGEKAIVEKRFKIERHRRPLTELEDSQVWVRNDAIEAIGHELARAACSVSHKKIDAARAPAR